MSSNEIPRASSPQPESSAGFSVFLNNNNTNVQTTVAATPAKKTRTRKEIKPKFTPACENCRVKKLRCIHRRLIGQETDTTSVPAEPVRSEEPEGPRTKRLRSTLRNPAHDDLIRHDTVPVEEPAEPAAQPGRQALASRKRKRSRDETEESAVGTSANPTIAGPSQSEKQKHSLPAANRRSTLQEISTMTWCGTMEERFQRRLRTAKEQWRRLGATIGIAHTQFDELVENMDAMGHILKEWDEKFPGA